MLSFLTKKDKNALFVDAPPQVQEWMFFTPSLEISLEKVLKGSPLVKTSTHRSMELT